MRRSVTFFAGPEPCYDKNFRRSAGGLIKRGVPQRFGARQSVLHRPSRRDTIPSDPYCITPKRDTFSPILELNRTLPIAPLNPRTTTGSPIPLQTPWQYLPPPHPNSQKITLAYSDAPPHDIQSPQVRMAL